MFLALSPACSEKHSLGELSGSAGEPSSSTGEPPDSSTGEPSGGTSEPPDSTSGTTTGEPPTTEGGDPCAQHLDQTSCEAAGCEYVGGAPLEADEDGCRVADGEYGFCASITGGNQSPALRCAPDGTPVVFAFDPFELPEGWGSCDCETQGLAIDCYAVNSFLNPGGCGALVSHCESLTDEASCNQFQGEPGLNGCLWVESTIEVLGQPACNAEPPVGRCIPVYLRQDGGCIDPSPPDSCDPVDAVKAPYVARVSEDGAPVVELDVIDDVSCQFEPLGYQQCWADAESPAACDCVCDL